MKTILPPGPRGLPLLGSLRSLRANRLDFISNNRDTYGDIVYFRVGPRRVYQLNNPEYVQYVLVKHPEKFHKSSALKRATKQTIGQGLLTSDGELHKRQRKLVQPSFHHNRISVYADVMVQYTNSMLEDWTENQCLDIAHEMMRLTMRIVAKTLFDADVSEDANSIGAAITTGLEATMERITRLTQIFEKLPTPTNQKRHKAFKFLDDTITGIINERRSRGEDKGDLLSMLLMAEDEETGDQMSNEQVRDEAVTLFIAGHETTANALAWTFYLLSQHPEVEYRLVAEIRDVLAGRNPTLADLQRLPCLLMVIKESMRLYPPAWVTTREVQESFELGGYTIPKGSMVMTSTYAIHRDPRYWEKPELFIPERFSTQNEAQIPKYAYFPFGGGPRVCVGNQFAMMEAQLVLATILQRYHLSLIQGQQIIPQPLVTLRPKYGIKMVINHR
ncbi:MAG: cytochrome P450 [Anaerolineae bacterium]